ncbi:MAG: tRNA (adenosine(37)-N6)-threonylcarbamoyltransferase complex ATPase subunit type 1 TsaE [Clostridia bacterium]|nr:tRNA (adenosine(37)-N6)-threonylcarbamoyltransferase complex ATPase subunit type 1 TsaE [Clostridia bacterium]
MAVFISRSPEQTIEFGIRYAKNLNKNDVIVLNGEMGAGKTVFSKGVAMGLGITEEVLSPTYAYMNDYNGKLFHFDCYRLKNGGQAEALGLCDYFYAGGVCLVEWAENIKEVLPANRKTVTIRKTAEGREITYD